MFEREPIDRDDPLIGLENVVLAPHIASVTTEARSRMAEVSARNIILVLSGEALQFLVNPDVMRVRPLSAVRMIV